MQNRYRRFWLFPLICLLLALCAGCGRDAAAAQVILTFESIEADELVCTQGSGASAETVTVRPNGLLSQSELDALVPGDQLTVSYYNRTARDIDATGITIEHTGVPETPGTDAPPAAPDDTASEPGNAPALRTPDNEAELIDFFQSELFREDALFRRALDCAYDSPAEADLFQMFCSGIPGQAQVCWEELTEPERSALEKSPLYQKDAALDAFTTEELNDALETCFGVDLGAIQGIGLERLIYLPEFDRYYAFHTDTSALPPIEIEQVQTDGTGCYYLRYTHSETASVWLCCLRQDGEQWTLVYNLEAPEDIPLAAAAPDGAEQVWDYMPLRPAVSDDLEEAVRLLLREELWAYTPSDSALRAEAHDILGVRRTGDELTVYAIVRWKAYDTGHGERTAIYSRTECVRLGFWRWSSSERLYYESDEVYYYEDPAAAGLLFPGEDWLEASGLTRSQLESALDAQCDASLDASDVHESDAFYAALSGRSAAEAAQKLSDTRAQRNATRFYRLLGVEESQKATAALLDGIGENPYAVSAGWDTAYAEAHVRAVEVTYARESDPALSTEADGVFLQTFYLCEDPETGMWRVWGHDEGMELFGYEATLPG